MAHSQNKHLGFSLIELLVVVIIIGIIAAISIPSLLSARKTANEASAVQTLRTIHSANTTYFATQGNLNNYATLTQLSDAGLVDSTFTGASFQKSGYTIEESIGPSIYCSKALPIGNAGTKWFGISHVGVIYKANSDSDITCTSGAFGATGSASPY